MNTAIFITGTICSGKSTLSERIGNALNIDVISETNSNGFFGIIDKIKNNEFTSPVIVEHAEIYNLINKNRELEISKYFDKMIIILINVSNDILTANLNDRKSRNIVGDYLKIDMFEMKKSIENHFNEIPMDFIKYIVNVNIVDDYEFEYKKIIAFLIDNLRT
ncbi:MAG: AAA family ATPase [Defluviitaleaceae bacterium]|nr:AAA family ATPase [Defluviitaleaceae bacterium]